MSTTRAIRIEGGLFSSDTLEALARGEGPGQRPQDFGLDAARSLSDDLAERFRDALHLWTAFRNRLARLPETDSAAAVTRDAWVTPFLSLLDYQIVPNPRHSAADRVPFPVSHRAGDADDAPPIHIVGARQELGRVAVASGLPRMSPHALLQEHLNVSDALWGMVTNGVVLRLLRTSAYLRRQAYVEFDLKAILEEQRFTDFALLFRLIHRSRLPTSSADAHACLLEQYYQRAIEQGGRVRERLRDGVEAALHVLANGFLAHSANNQLRAMITGSAKATGMDAQAAELYRQTLRLVYRFLFLLVAEERGLMDDTGHPGADAGRADGVAAVRAGGGDSAMHRLYRDHYGVGRLGRLAMDRRAYDDHDDLWHGLRALWRTLADETLAAILGAPPLNGDLFAPLALDDCSIANRDLLAAIRHLTYYRERDDAPLRRVNYAALDVEELGSVYESLLDYHPVIEADGARLRFNLIAGSERKSTGSYYTPPELVQELVRSALEPVIAGRLAGARGAAARERALLSIRVLDPACGSGHFLLAAARRLGKELARIRTGEDEPAPERVREAIRAVTAHCIYGVDKNPLAVELCKVALWLEAHNPGKPLTFLDHRIRCGDSLVGVVDLDLVRQGIPDAAFEPKEGDDRALARSAKRRNAAERSGQLTLRFEEPVDLSDLSRAARELGDMSDDTPQQVREKRQRFDALRQAQQPLRLACDLWTAAFFQRLAPGETIITSAVVADALEGRPVHAALPAQRRFFHWALEFPEAFAAGGFDVILGNPPWERIKLQEQEFFASRDAQVANAPNAAARRRMIDRLQQTNPALWQEFADALCAAAAASQFLRGSGRFPLTGTGDINTYAVFAELAMQLLAPRGRAGVITPTGIATDATTQRFFRTLTGSGRLVSLYDFENRKAIFPEVHRSYKFCLLTMRGAAPLTAGAADGGAAEFAFFCHSADDLRDAKRRFTLTPEDFRLLNPNTGTAPIFRSRRDAELTKAIYRRVPPLVRDDGGAAGNPWGVTFMTMFHMANDSHLFRGARAGSHPHPLPLPHPGGGEVVPPPPPAPPPSRGRGGGSPHPLPLAHPGGGTIAPTAPTAGEGAAVPPHPLPLAHPGGGTIAPTAPTAGEGAAVPPHPLPLAHPGGGEVTPPSPLAGEGGRGGEGAPAPFDRWGIPEALRRKMVEVARQFRKHPTRSEEMLWEALRRKSLHGIKVRRQQPIGPFVVDFYVSSHRLIIEVDGGVHATQQEADRRRQELLESLGLRFLRLPADLVERDLPHALEIIRQALDHPHAGGGAMEHPHPLPLPHQGGGAAAPAAPSPRSPGGSGGQGGEGAGTDLPLYEAKLIHQFDHRWATYDGDAPRDLTAAEKADPSCVVTPRYWVPAAEVEARLAAKGWTRPWLLGWRDITNATNERTVIAAVIPRVGVGHKYLLMLIDSADDASLMVSLLNSLVLDYCARQKLGGTDLTFSTMKQLPVLPPAIFAQPCPWDAALSVGEFVRPRALELTYTAWDLAPFARELGYDGPPFRFDPERRFALRCELDAAFFHLYLPAEADGSWRRAAPDWAPVAEADDDLARLTALFPTPRDAVAYILDQFPIVRRKDEAQFGAYRTKETILAIYDAMQDAQRRGARG